MILLKYEFCWEWSDVVYFVTNQRAKPQVCYTPYDMVSKSYGPYDIVNNFVFICNAEIFYVHFFTQITNF